MITGTARKDEAWPEYDEEHLREQYYSTTLDAFGGVEGTSYGIMDELYDLGKLLETIGQTVVKEEKDFREIEKAERDPDGYEMSSKILAAWHKKMYRPFTYRAMLMLIHSHFEDASILLYRILVEEGRIKDTVHKEGILDILKELRRLDSSLPALYDKVRGFNFLRNKLAHADGNFHEKERDYDAFKRLYSSRADIEIIKHSFPKGKFTHSMKVIKSTIHSDYLEVIKQIFIALLKGAASLDYNPIVPQKEGWWRQLLIRFKKWIKKVWQAFKSF